MASKKPLIFTIGKLFALSYITFNAVGIIISYRYTRCFIKIKNISLRCYAHLCHTLCCYGLYSKHFKRNVRMFIQFVHAIIIEDTSVHIYRFNKTLK